METTRPRRGWHAHHREAIRQIIEDLMAEDQIELDAWAGMDPDAMSRAVDFLHKASGALLEAERDWSAESESPAGAGEGEAP